MSGKLHVTAILKINPDHIKEAEPCLRKLAEESEKEEGSLGYAVYPVAKKPGEYIIQETYKSPEALKAHQKTPHFTGSFAKLGGWLAAPPEIRLYSAKL